MAVGAMRWVAIAGALAFGCSEPPGLPTPPARMDSGLDVDATDADTAVAVDAGDDGPSIDDGVEMFDGDVRDADTGMLDADVPDADVPDADVPDADMGVPDAETGAPDVDTGVPDADTGVPPGPPSMTFTFVSAALNGGMDGGPQMRAVIVWHGALRGQSADGGIRFEGWFR